MRMLLSLAACGLMLAGCETPLDEEREAAILALEADADLGADAYSEQCARCHGDDGAGDDEFPDIRPHAEHVVWAMLTGPGPMPTFGNRLEDQTMADISAFVGTL